MEEVDSNVPDLPETETAIAVTVGCAKDLPPGRSAVVEISGGIELAVFNVGGEFHAIDNSCPHKGAPLSEGIINGHVVECGWHAWRFDVRTGQCVTNFISVKTYSVYVEDGLIKVRT